MRRLLPHPLLFIALVLMWLLLQQAAGPGQWLTGAIVAFGAVHAMARLHPERVRVRAPLAVVRLACYVVIDVIRSNFAVCAIILAGRRREVTSGFLVVPLQLRDRTGLALFSVILTATPGSAWLEYSPAKSTVLIHVFDLKDEQEWIETLKRRYESLLLEIFQ